MYAIIKPFLFLLPPEVAHDVTLKTLTWMPRFFFPTVADDPVEVMGLSFKNRVGLAAGLDKNADYLDGLAKLGFGFIEVGTVTPKPQPGNEKPRLFRLPPAQALINRMGFNNKGVDHLVERVKASHYDGILGINIGKNKTTPNDKAVDDYLTCFNKVYPYASYITVNISSPNTPGLRELQQGTQFIQLLDALKQAQQRNQQTIGRYVPITLKLAPDLSSEQLAFMAEQLLAYRIDGVIATNTTNSRQGVESLADADQQGGLSGKPLQSLSTHCIHTLNDCLQQKIPIIGVGGITDNTSAKEKFTAGASLIQLYTGLIYRGPALVAEASN